MFELEEIIEELERRQQEGGCFERFFHTQEERDKYPHWMEAFRVGKDYRQRLALCANQVGKTTFGMFEVTCHLTGLYPDWWEGFRFDGPNEWWLGGVTSTEVKNNLQDRLLGSVGSFGTGFIPADCIDFETLKDAKKADTPVRTFRVKHVSGGWSTVTLKSYAEGREKWQAKPGISILLDEEPPLDVYVEALMRTIAGNGRVILTFTPLKGVSDTVMNYLGDDVNHPMGEVSPGRYLIRATWDDTPHLTEEAKDALINSIPPYQRDARTKGIPTLGSGSIYPVSETQVFIDPFPIPKHWKRCAGMDVGWKRTAAVWGAIDPETGITYVYGEHYLAEQPPAVHASAIKSFGDWIPIAIDPASRGRTQDEGRRLIDLYKEQGLNLHKADNAVEGRLFEIYQALLEGRLRIFNTCTNLLKEYRLYRRDEKGNVVKKDDHAMDALRYLWSTGRGLACVQTTINTNPLAGIAVQPLRF
jgi:phage terminase large subunit-like protein